MCIQVPLLIVGIELIRNCQLRFGNFLGTFFVVFSSIHLDLILVG